MQFTGRIVVCQWLVYLCWFVCKSGYKSGIIFLITSNVAFASNQAAAYIYYAQHFSRSSRSHQKHSRLVYRLFYHANDYLGGHGRAGNPLPANTVHFGFSVFYFTRGLEHLFDFDFCSVPLEIEKIKEQVEF